MRSGGIDCAIQWIDHRGWQNALAFRGIRQCVEVEITLHLPVTFIIAEEKQLVLDNRAADGDSELIAVQDGLGRAVELCEVVSRV